MPQQTIFVPQQTIFVPQQTAAVSHSPHLHVSISTPMAFVTTSVVPSPIHVAPVVVNTPTSGVPTNDNLTANFNPLPTNICTPVNIDNLEFANHPNKTLTEFLINGFRFGFDIGYRGPLTPGSTRNLLSAHSNPLPVTEALSKELVRGHTAGPFSSPHYQIFIARLLAWFLKKMVHSASF